MAVPAARSTKPHEASNEVERTRLRAHVHSTTKRADGYERRRPEETALHKVVKRAWPSAPQRPCCAPDIVGRLSSPYRKYGCGNRPSSRALATEGGSALVRLESVARPPIALERLTRRYDNCVEYAFRKPWRDGTRAARAEGGRYARAFVCAMGQFRRRDFS